MNTLRAMLNGSTKMKSFISRFAGSIERAMLIGGSTIATPPTLPINFNRPSTARLNRERTD